MTIKKIFKFIVSLVLGLIILAICTLSFFRIMSMFRESQTNVEAAPSSGRFVGVDGIGIYIQEMGNPSDPAVMFIHGTGAWSETWKETMTAIAAEGFYAVAIDIPPFGYSDRPRDGSYTRTAQAKRIVGVIDALKIDKVILVGHSYGGGATAEAAFMAPEKMQALVLVDPALGLQATSEESPVINMFLAISPLRNSFLSTTITNPLFTRTLLKLFIANPLHATDEWVKIYQQPMNVKGTTKNVGVWLPTLLQPPEKSLSTDIESYRKLGVPTAIIWGEKDSVTPLSQGLYLSENMPAATLKILPEVGHIPQIENPVEFHKTLLEFLRQHKSPTI